jgi:ubiquitin-conjugating enzyme E2 variant
MNPRFAPLLLILCIAATPPASAGLWGKKPVAAQSQQRLDGFRTKLSRDAEKLREVQKLRGEERKEARHEYAKPGPKGLLPRSMVFFNYVMTALIGYQAATGIHVDPHAILPLLYMAPGAYAAADATTEVVHKLIDSYMSENNRFWGETVRNFRKHHEVPDNLNREDFVGNIGVASTALAPFFAATAAANIAPEWKSAILVYLVAGMHATAIHLQAHKSDPHPIARFFQKMGLTLTQRQHMKHHSPPHDGEYALVRGFSSPIFRKMKLWHRMDMAWWKLVKRMPHNWIQDPRSIPAEVIESLQKDLESIPLEELHAETRDTVMNLWDSTETFPTRVNEEVSQVVSQSRARWRGDFIQKRREIFVEQAEREGQESAETEWAREQAEYPWIYGEKPTPLFPSSAE